jgi:curli biogenesis system outer membrane secretion channel CsgG
MKKLFTVITLGIALAGAALAQNSRQTAETDAAVVEFSSGANASGMTAEAKRQLQTNLAAALAKSVKFDIADVRHTQRASKENLAAINSGSSTAAAVKLGKQLGVKYVVTGTVTEYTPKDADGYGRVAIKTRVIEVATGKVVHTGDASHRSPKEMKTGSMVEMQAFVVKPAILKLAEGILELNL